MNFLARDMEFLFGLAIPGPGVPSGGVLDHVLASYERTYLKMCLAR